MQTPPLAARSSTDASLHLVSSSDTASSVPRALSSTQSPIPVTGGTEYSVIQAHFRTEISMEKDNQMSLLGIRRENTMIPTRKGITMKVDRSRNILVMHRNKAEDNLWGLISIR